MKKWFSRLFHPEAHAAGTQSPPEWDLSDLYAGLDDPRIDGDIAEAAAKAKEFALRYEGKIAESLGSTPPEALSQMLEAYEAVQDIMGRLASYASLRYAAETSDSDIGRFYGRIQETLTEIESDLIFFRLELNNLEDDLVAAATAEEPGARFASWLENLRSFKPFQLAPELEKLLHEKELTAASAWSRLFDETIADLRFTVRGEQKTSQEALDYLSSHDASLRADAAAGLAEGFKSNIKLFTYIMNALLKDKAIEDSWRGLPDPTHHRHLSNQIEPEVVEALVGSVKGAYADLSHRYYKIKAQAFGMEALNYWDRNAPWPQTNEPDLSWPEAQDRVLDAYGAFSPEMAAIARRFFEGRWIDARVRPGKAPGAFAHPTVPSAHPYVLMNYLGKSRDVMTLAHELGHGVHQVLAAEQGLLLSSTPLTLAETASVFGEMLTFQKILTEAVDPALRRVLLAQKVEDMLNTVVRQIAFYDFETRLHGARKEGELTPETIGEIWLDVQKESLGPAIRQNEGYEFYWCYIPHFIHSPFYVYAYAFGDCLVNALYAVYQNSDEGFAERYLDLLRAGGSKRHDALLAPFGLDARDPAFWNKGIGLISHFIDDLEGAFKA